MGSESPDAKYARRRYQERKVLSDAIKLKSGCIDCGYRSHPAALQFDHLISKDKKFRVSISLSRLWSVVLDEIAKCGVRCANCHAIKTKLEGVGFGRPRSVADASVERRRKINRDNGAKKYQERRRVVDVLKVERGCIDCGFNSHPEALQFDHCNPEEKAFKIAHALCYKWEKVSKEIAKCEVRCANCHSIKTQENMEMGRGGGHKRV